MQERRIHIGYPPQQGRDARLSRVRQSMQDQDLDSILVYYDEVNIGNGWYPTGWCPQFVTGYEISDSGPIPFSKTMDERFNND